MGENFHRISKGVDVRPLIDSIASKPHLWSEITARQTTPGSPHSDTESIFLRWCESQAVEAAFSEIKAIDYPALKELPEVSELLDYIMRITSATELGRVLIVNFKPGGVIERHVDEGAYAAAHQRIHLSIQSEDGNHFFGETISGCGEFVHMQPGELWWFDNKRPHWLTNNSSKPRIHLIVDVVAPRPTGSNDEIFA